jgi:predicted small metal-binding protein
MSTMAGTFKRVECDPPCGFMVKSHDEREVIELVKQHAKKVHNMDVTEKDIKSKLQSV